MRVLFASSEIYPLTNTGGLADVSAALPMALTELGVDMHFSTGISAGARSRCQQIGRARTRGFHGERRNASCPGGSIARLHSTTSPLSGDGCSAWRWRRISVVSARLGSTSRSINVSHLG